jgi:hypothetical protein
LVKQQIEVVTRGYFLIWIPRKIKINVLLLLITGKCFVPITTSLAKEDVFLGPGAALLLHLIVE